MLSYAYLDPDDVFLGPGDTAIVRPKEIDCDTYFNCTLPFTPYVTGWEVTDPYGAVLYYDNGDNLDLVGFNGGTAYIQANIGYERYYWNGEWCNDEGMDIANANGDARVLHLNSISPSRGVISATTHVTITGTNFASGATINVGGSGITVSNRTVNSSTSITADFVVAANATGGNHSVSVTVNGKTSNSVYFFVQVPTTFTPISLSSANLGCASTAAGYGGQVLYGVLDQDGQPMLAAGYTPQEHFTQNGVPAFSGFKFFADPPTTDSSGRFLDKPVGTCFDPTPSSNLCVDVVQTFNIVVGTVTYTIPTVTTRRDCVQGIRVTVTNGSVSLSSSLGTVN